VARAPEKRAESPVSSHRRCHKAPLVAAEIKSEWCESRRFEPSGCSEHGQYPAVTGGLGEELGQSQERAERPYGAIQWALMLGDTQSQPKLVLPMFVQDFKIVDRPYEEVVSRFSTGIQPLLESGLGPALNEVERLRMKVAPVGWPAALAKTVRVSPGPVRSVGAGTSVAFSWSAEGGTSLFPSLEADIELTPFGLSQTFVALHGRYKPPGGSIGKRADVLLLHLIAESTIRAFLAGVCENLTCGVSEPVDA
jgi:hypothetical protein